MIKQTHLSRAVGTSPPVAIEVGKLKIQSLVRAALGKRNDVIERDIGGLHLPPTQATLPAVAGDDGVEVNGANRGLSLTCASPLRAATRTSTASPNRVLVADELLPSTGITALAATFLAAINAGRRALKPRLVFASVKAVARLAARSYRDVTQGFAALRTGGIAAIVSFVDVALSAALAGSRFAARFTRLTLADAHTSEYNTQ